MAAYESHIRGGAEAILREMKKNMHEVAEPLEKRVHDLAVAGNDYATNISQVGTDAKAGTFKDGWHVVDYAPRRVGDPPMSQIRNDTEGGRQRRSEGVSPCHTVNGTVNLSQPNWPM